MFTGHSERLPNEDGIFARCIYKQLTINTQRAIDNERGDVLPYRDPARQLQLEPRVFRHRAAPPST